MKRFALRSLITIFFLGFFCGAIVVVLSERSLFAQADQQSQASSGARVNTSVWQTKDFIRFRQLISENHLSVEAAAAQVEAERLLSSP